MLRQHVLPGDLHERDDRAGRDGRKSRTTVDRHRPRRVARKLAGTCHAARTRHHLAV